MSEKYKYHAFISYSRRDFDEVNVILQKIQAEVSGFKYWFDLEGIESGDEFVRKIVSAIDESERILFMLSDNSINSKWAEQEVMYARNSGKRIIPVLLKGAKLKGWFLFTFGNIDSIDTQEPRQISKLLTNLHEWCDSKSTKSVAVSAQFPKTTSPQAFTSSNINIIQGKVKTPTTYSEQNKTPTKQVNIFSNSMPSQKEVGVPEPIKKIYGKWGYKDKKGNIVVPFIYDEANSFSEGRAKVRKGSKYGYIGMDGSAVIPFIYDEAYSFSEGRAVIGRQSKFGYIDLNGTVITNCIYDYAAVFSEGRALVKKDRKYGYINVDGNLIIPFIYDYATDFSDGRASVKKDGKYGYIDLNGSCIIPFNYDFAMWFSNSRAAVIRDGKYGYIDLEGNIIVPFIYDGAESYSDGRAKVRKDGREFYIDKNGNEIK